MTRFLYTKESDLPVTSFNDFELSPEVKKAIDALGYESPSPIQEAVLPILLNEDTDFIGQAATGTGKTAAFGIPLIERIDPKSKAVQGLILCPTRELAVQVGEQIDLLGKYKGIESVTIYGGATYDRQIHGLKRGTPIVVGTPGRILDHIRRGTLKLSALKIVILDEADEMISMGFKEDLETILENTPQDEIQTWLFSATMSRQVRQVADQYLNNPKQVTIAKKEGITSSATQLYYPVHESDKPEVLCKIIDAADDFYGLIFCQTKSLVVDLTEYLLKKKYSVDCLHGDMSQASRERTMTRFRDRDIKILVCTDVASRGLDVKDVTHVINFSVPREIDVYIHRIGRTARGGKGGMALSLVTPSQRGLLRRIEQVTRIPFAEGKIPKRKDIALKKVSSTLDKFKSQMWHDRAIESLDDQWKEMLSNMPPEEIAGRFLTMIFEDLFSDRAVEKEIRTHSAPRDDRPHSRGGRGDRGGGGRHRSGNRSDSRSDGRGPRRDRPERGRGRRR